MRSFSIFSLVAFSISLQAQLPAFDVKDQPAAPDYTLEKNWSALPFRNDAADRIPKAETWVNDSLKAVDVFYIYPTLYMKGKTWNANLDSKKLNKRLDNYPVRYQGGVFNESCRVYAPRYRQAIIDAFSDSIEGTKSLAFAYEDVKKAFQCYLDHYNKGRPFIIASHSQGSYHARRLLREMIDSTDLRKRMVAAYVIGYAMDTASYKVIKPCFNESQTGCYVTWASYKKGVTPSGLDLYGNVCVNPITWTNSHEEAPKLSSKGAMLLSFNKKYMKNVSAEIHNNYLWVKTSMPFFSLMDVLHVADYNLFWYDIRENVKKRIDAYLRK